MFDGFIFWIWSVKREVAGLSAKRTSKSPVSKSLSNKINSLPHYSAWVLLSCPSGRITCNTGWVSRPCVTIHTPREYFIPPEPIYPTGPQTGVATIDQLSIERNPCLIISSLILLVPGIQGEGSSKGIPPPSLDQLRCIPDIGRLVSWKGNDLSGKSNPFSIAQGIWISLLTESDGLENFISGFKISFSEPDTG